MIHHCRVIRGGFLLATTCQKKRDGLKVTWLSIPEKQSSATMPIEIGGQVEVTKAELRYIIVDYKVSGLTNRL
jgi:hypothetical protein